MGQIKTVKGQSGMYYYYTHKGETCNVYIKNRLAESYYKQNKNSLWQLIMIAKIKSIPVNDIEFLYTGSF
jgi:hypothetical protein